MSTRFRVFQGANQSHSIEQDVNSFMADVESKGGKFIESHWSSFGRSETEPLETLTLVVVYEEAPSKRVLGKVRSY